MAEIWGVAIAGVAAAGASAYGATASSSAAKGAASAQTNAANNATATQEAEFNASAGLNTPGRNLGYGADGLLAELFGLPNPNSSATTSSYGANSALTALGGGAPAAAVPVGTPVGGGGQFPSTATFTTGGANPGGAAATGGATPLGNQTTSTASNGSPTTTNASSQFQNFYDSPGYQFALGQGQQAVTRGAAATGGLYSTNTLNQLDSNAQGFASQQYQNYVQQLFSLAGIGGSAIAGTQGAATTAGNNISANQLSAGNANASGILGSAGAYTGAVNNTAGILGNYLSNSGGGTGTSGALSSVDPGGTNFNNGYQNVVNANSNTFGNPLY